MLFQTPISKPPTAFINAHSIKALQVIFVAQFAGYSPERLRDERPVHERFAVELAQNRFGRTRKPCPRGELPDSAGGISAYTMGPPIEIHFDEPFYVGAGFCSHLPDKADSAVLSNVILENSAGKVR